MGEENTTTPAWGKPIPFETVNVPDFPIESLPGPIFAYVEALAEFTQTPVEMAAVLSLGVLATAFQSKYEVEDKNGHREQLSLYTVAVASPGERKSAVHSAITHPLYDYEFEKHKMENADVEYSKAEKEALEQMLASEKKSMSSGKTQESKDRAAAEVRILIDRLEDFEEKVPCRLLVDDTTPEKLIEIMEEQGGCIAISSAEGGIFDTLSGRYDKNMNLSPYLSGHSGDTIKVDRIGRKGNYIRNPRLTMMLTIQPEVLNGFLSNAAFKGRGLCGRFLYVICESRVGYRKMDTEPIPIDIEKDYKEIIMRALNDPNTGIIRLSDEASEIYLEHKNAVERRQRDEWEHMKDWASKLAGETLRIAALIHAASSRFNPAEITISAETIEAATKISECLGVHAMAAYQAMGADEAEANARYLWKRIRSTGKWSISKRDLFNICKGKLKNVESMEPALKLLVEMNYIQEAQQNTGGRPTMMLFVNPNAVQD